MIKTAFRGNRFSTEKFICHKLPFFIIFLVLGISEFYIFIAVRPQPIKARIAENYKKRGCKFFKFTT